MLLLCERMSLLALPAPPEERCSAVSMSVWAFARDEGAELPLPRQQLPLPSLEVMHSQRDGVH